MRIREELKETDAVRHERRFCLHLWAACFVFVLLAGGACGSVYAETFEVTNDLWVNANLSVGTTVPSASLTIQGAGSDSGFSLRIADSEATDRLVVQDNGNLGIGTTSPLEAVHLTAGSLRQDSAVAPVVVGSLQNDTAFNAPEYVYVSGKYAYVTSDEGDRLNIVDVSSPENPVLISSLYNTTHLGDASGVMVAGKYAYIACQSGNRLTVVDVSNASNPQIAGSLYNDTLFTDIERLYVSGRYAYLAQGDYFTVVDVSDVNNPRITGVLNNSTLLGTTYAIYVSGRYAYVGTYYGNSLVVVDVSNASNPEIAGYVEGIAINPRSVCVNGRYAYVTLSDDRLEIVDVSDPGSPLSVGTLYNETALNGTRGLFVSGRYAYVTARDANRLTVVEIPSIDSPAASIGDIAASSVEVSENVDVGNNLYVRSGINVGPGGIKSDGPLTITGEGTAPSSSLEIRSAGAGNDFYLNIANGKLLMKSADNTCSACGPYNNNTWACVSVTCP